jgi:hydrogenase nickel incorporation protein HypB
VHEPILSQNDRLAERNRGFFQAHSTRAINVMSSPGSGKTTLLEKSLAALAPASDCAVLVGDLATDLDARRLDGHGAQILQITTGTACHLDATMIASACQKLSWESLRLLVVENVGNLVCPAEFNLGEDAKVMILSIPEGHDKPLKYPLMFTESNALILNKVDLLPYTDFNMDELKRTVTAMNPAISIFPVSAKTGEGLADFTNWLETKIAGK